MTYQNENGLVTIFGGSGFLGRHIIRLLARKGFRIRVAVRRPHLANYLQPMGFVGQIVPVQANLRDRASVERAMSGADAIVNLVGILYEGGKQRFETLHEQGPYLIGDLARAQNITNIVHISAIGADANSPSAYARSKAAGEAAISDRVPGTVIMRPSVVFGPDDQFFNKLADMACMAPALPLFGGGKTRLQPVFVGDVAEAVVRAVMGRAQRGQIYELGGPQIVSLRECFELTLEMINRRRLMLPLPFSLSAVMGMAMQLLPRPPLTADQVELLKSDNVVSAKAEGEGRDLSGLKIAPSDLRAILPGYLYRYRKNGQYTLYQVQD